MTLVLALACADGLLLASDSQATVSTGGQPVRHEVEKLHQPWSNVAWGAAGTVAVIQQVDQALAKAFSHNNVFENKKIVEVKEAVAQVVTKTVRNTLQAAIQVPGEGLPYTDFLFVGQVPEGSFIMEIHKNLTYTDHITTGYSAIGSGDIFPYFALAVVKHYQVAQRPMHEAKLIACRILEDAISTAAQGLGPPVRMVEIAKKEGASGEARMMSQEDIRVLSDKVVEWKEVESESLSSLVGIGEVGAEEVATPEDAG